MTLTVTEPDSQAFAERLRNANHADRDAMLRNATPDEAIVAVRALGLRELYELPREIVESWEPDATVPGSARFIRAERLTTEWYATDIRSMWRIADIARAARVRQDSVGRWRTNHIKRDPDRTKCLPEPDDSIGDIKKPGDDPKAKGGSGIPLFHPKTALEWLKWAKKVTDDVYPRPEEEGRGGGRGTGRPPKQRGDE